ncbi:hypothetical protein BDZ91DRAFT_718584 [Kalaharituber pfeilii]|nr:hypothetical protein BDZ91DRAFT_718584 [Kalaharituber pfeilii]
MNEKGTVIITTPDGYAASALLPQIAGMFLLPGIIERARGSLSALLPMTSIFHGYTVRLPSLIS